MGILRGIMSTMFIQRELASKLQKSKKSLLLLGPRQTGKSTLIANLDPQLILNLADEETYLRFASHPGELKERLAVKNVHSVFIDEVQRLPTLLNTIQSILDEPGKNIQFYLTGSSARKLKRGKANLLPGRIHVYHLGPFAFGELQDRFDSNRALETGLLPGIYLEEDREERIKTLRSYSATYLKEEIQAEALIRNLEGFSRFLFVAAHWSGRFSDFSKVASESQISRQSAFRFFEILEDTLILHRCPPFSKNARKRIIQHPKFYFFDTGVLNALLGSFDASPDRIGLLFEHLFFNQLLIHAYNQDRDISISSYRTEHGAEVDFIVELDGKVWAIELKASQNITKVDFRGFASFNDYYGKPHQRCVAYSGSVEKKIENVFILPWQKVIANLFA